MDRRASFEGGKGKMRSGFIFRGVGLEKGERMEGEAGVVGRMPIGRKKNKFPLERND